VVITFVTAVASETSTLSAVQLLWINIMDTFAALALATDPASPALLDRIPDKNTFVFAQIFNLVNSRQLDRKLNIFEGILSDWCSMVITIIGELSLSPFELPS
jgi:Ca2+-transporting ATPase